MKIQIVDDAQKFIQGYKTVLFSEMQSSFVSISNNECESILANDVLDYVMTKDILQIIQLLVSKLRFNGTLVIGGKDLQMFCKHVNNGLINEETAGQIISTCKSLSNYITVRDIMSSMGLKIESIQLNGIHYEITATRPLPN
jgi:hypothetical protein